jgi:ATP/maltotriose-dependent transcriptional regulator MalT
MVAVEFGPGRLVGRGAELAALCRSFEDLRGPRVVLLVGEPGIGKTALLATFVEHVRVARALRTCGYEDEQHVPLGVVRQLAYQVELPAGLQGAVEGTAQVDPLRAGAALLDVLTPAEDAPSVLVVDDVHWADEPSVRALVFALRRLQNEPILAVFATRTEEAATLASGLLRLVDGPTGSRLDLQGLSEAAVIELARDRRGAAISASAVARLHEHTSGNPLHLDALLGELDTEVLQEVSDEPLPAPRTYPPLVLARLAGASSPARDLVVAAAILGHHPPLADAAELAELAEPLEAFDQAIATGLVAAAGVAGAVRVTFTHPLVRAAVYHDLDLARRGRLHDRAARLVRDPVAALRHRVAAADGPNEVLVTDLVAAASADRRRGAWISAGTWLVAARRLSADPGARRRLLTDAADALLAAGQRHEAEALLAGADVDDGPRMRSLRGRLAAARSDLPTAFAQLRAAWQECSGEQGELACGIAAKLAALTLNDGDMAGAAEWSARAVEADPQLAAMSTVPLVRVGSLIGAGELTEALAVAEEQVSSTQGTPAVHVARLARGVAYICLDRLDAARQELAAAAGWVDGPHALRDNALHYLAEAHYRAGDWDDASAIAESAVSIVASAEVLDSLGRLHAVASYPLSARGQWDRAGAHVEAASAANARLGDLATAVAAAMARARLAHARGDWEEVVAALEPVALLPPSTALEEPGIQPWRGLYAEGLMHVDRRDDGAFQLDRFDLAVRERQLVSARLLAARVRVTLHQQAGELDDAAASGQAALDRDGVAAFPFEAALLRLGVGSVLRRSGQRRRAAEALRAADEGLARLGAEPYRERCRTELAACGLTPAKRSEGPRRDLTPQEHAVAVLVAKGLTNRQVAAELIVSAKTVEYHLGKVYAKLGVRSRTELAATFRPAAST